MKGLGLGVWCLKPLYAIFHLYRGGQFIGGGNRSARRNTLTCRKYLTNFIACCCIECGGVRTPVSVDRH